MPEKTCPSGSFSYTVQTGDTLWRLAQRFNTRLESIAGINPDIQDPNKLEVGQVICIPGTPPPSTTCPFGLRPYTIRSGDTLWDIARRHRTTVEAILYYNPGLDPNYLRIGQIICLPPEMGPPGTCPVGLTPYTIQAGDTLWELARRRGTTVQNILSYNPGLDPNYLQVGRIICLP